MNFSIFTYLTSFFISAILIWGLNLYVKSHSKIVAYWPSALLIMFFIPILRLLVAIELPFAHVVESRIIYPALYNLFFDNIMEIENFTVANVLIASWLLGAMLLFIKEIIQYRKAVNFFACIPICNNTIETQLVHDILLSRGYKDKIIRVIRTSCTMEPMIFGFRPIIVLPDQQLNKSELKKIIAHELGHYFHGDLVFKWFLEVVCILYWWFPPIRILKKNIYCIMEIRADQFVLNGQDKLEHIAYMEILLKICRRKQQNGQKTLLTMPLFSYGDNTTIKRSFDAITNMEQKPQIKSQSLAIAIVASGLLLFSYGFVLQPEYNTPPTDQDCFQITAVDFYWIKNDNGGYDLYNINGQFMGWVPNIQDDLSDIPIRDKLTA